MKTINCKDAAKMLSEYTAGTLSGAHVALIENHMADCVKCQIELAKYKSMLAMLAERTTPEPSPLFWDNFPRQVLNAYKAELENQQKESWIIAKLRKICGLYPQLIMATAFSMLVAVAAIFTFSTSHNASDSLAEYLGNLKQPAIIAQQLNQNAQGEKISNIFSFSQSTETNYFVVGTLYSYASIYMTLNNQEKSSAYLSQIGTQTSNKNATNSKLQELITQLMNAPVTNTDRLSALSELYALLNEHPGEHNRNLHQHMLLLGLWTNNAIIAVSSHNLAALQEPAVLNQFIALAEYKNFSPKVSANLLSISQMLQQEAQLDQDSADTIAALCREIQTILL